MAHEPLTVLEMENRLMNDQLIFDAKVLRVLRLFLQDQVREQEFDFCLRDAS